MNKVETHKTTLNTMDATFFCYKKFLCPKKHPLYVHFTCE